MMVVPLATGVTKPAPLIVATDGTPPDHSPPGDASVTVAAWPRQNIDGPEMAAGNGLMVMVTKVLHPPGAV